MKLVFGDIVVVEKNFIGVVVKCWMKSSLGTGPTYEVYVRNLNAIKLYEESKVERYMVRHKELDEDEMFYQSNALES